MRPEHLNSAIAMAQSSTSKKKVGAVLLRKSKIISTAVNLEAKSHPTQAHYGERICREYNDYRYSEQIYLHAEINCLIRARSDADTIIVVRVNRQNQLRMSLPCPICMLALKEAKIKHCYYTDNVGFNYINIHS